MLYLFQFGDGEGYFGAFCVMVLFNNSDNKKNYFLLCFGVRMGYLLFLFLVNLK